MFRPSLEPKGRGNMDILQDLWKALPQMIVWALIQILIMKVYVQFVDARVERMRQNIIKMILSGDIEDTTSEQGEEGYGV